MRKHARASILLSLPAVLATLLIIIAPLLHALHLTKCPACRHAHISARTCCPVASRYCGKPCACSALTMAAHQEKEPVRDRKPHDPATCPFCQMYAALASGVVMAQPHAVVGVAYSVKAKPIPVQPPRLCIRITATSPRAPPCC